MLAGSICEGNECAGLVLFVLAVFAAIAVAAIAVAIAWAFVISAVLRRAGWSGWARRSASVLVVLVGGLVVVDVANAVGDLHGLLVLLVVVPPLPLLVWQRRARRTDQSSPCSTA
jgi:ATP/ADP translocase